MSKGATIAVVVVVVVAVLGTASVAMAAPKPVILPDLGPPPPPPPSLGKFVVSSAAAGTKAGLGVIKTALVGTDPNKPSFMDWIRTKVGG